MTAIKYYGDALPLRDSILLSFYYSGIASKQYIRKFYGSFDTHETNAELMKMEAEHIFHWGKRSDYGQSLILTQKGFELMDKVIQTNRL